MFALLTNHKLFLFVQHHAEHEHEVEIIPVPIPVPVHAPVHEHKVRTFSTPHNTHPVVCLFPEVFTELLFLYFQAKKEEVTIVVGMENGPAIGGRPLQRMERRRVDEGSPGSASGPASGSSKTPPSTGSSLTPITEEVPSPTGPGVAGATKSSRPTLQRGIPFSTALPLPTQGSLGSRSTPFGDFGDDLD